MQTKTKCLPIKVTKRQSAVTEKTVNHVEVLGLHVDNVCAQQNSRFVGRDTTLWMKDNSTSFWNSPHKIQECALAWSPVLSARKIQIFLSVLVDEEILEEEVIQDFMDGTHPFSTRHFFILRQFDKFLLLLLTRSCHAKAAQCKLNFLGMCYKTLEMMDRKFQLSVWISRGSVPMLFRLMTVHSREIFFPSSLPLSLHNANETFMFLVLYAFFLIITILFIHLLIHRRSYLQHVQHNGCTL